MAQPSVAAFFNTRKRAVAEGDAISGKTRRLADNEPSRSTGVTDANSTTTAHHDEIKQIKAATAGAGMRTRSGRVVKRIGANTQADVSPKKLSKVETEKQQQQTTLVPFIKKGPTTPSKKAAVTTAAKINAISNMAQEIQPATKENTQMQKLNEVTPSTTLTKDSTNPSSTAAQQALLRTPTKQIIKGSPVKHGELKRLVRKELNFDEVKSKITRSEKLQQLKASLNRIQELEKQEKAQAERARRLREGISSTKKEQATVPVVQLKQFDTIELEVLTSPAKTFKTPTKLPPKTPDKNELMSPRHTDVSKRILFSPAKNGTPPKMIVPAAVSVTQRYKHLIEPSSVTAAGHLPLPYKYRHLIEIFKAVDSVCAMFHNRKECITFKKLKPAVQRMLRKNFNELHLAQIKTIYPEAFLFTQMKMRNYGSTSKTDYFQLVITPNVENTDNKQQKLTKIDEEDVLDAAQTKCMNPQIMTERLQRFQGALLQRVKDEHNAFLQTLDPPLSIPKEKVTRWHPDFDLDKCSDIAGAHLPQPPNVEKYSSARDILSTARNLFNCATPMERAMERYEAKMAEKRAIASSSLTDARDDNVTTSVAAEAHIVGSNSTKTTTTLTGATTTIKNSSSKEPVTIATTTTTTAAAHVPPPAAPLDTISSQLKGLPKSLLDKIRAKQAAKALEAMTRRPSQDQEATKYSRLPELARHLRNVFITERKGVLPLELVLKKIQNSFRTILTHQEIEDHLRLIAKEASTWLAFHEVRKTTYLKIAKDMDLSKIIEQLEKLAAEKSK